MFYFLAEGYYHTKNAKKYAWRLFIFGIISWVPSSLFLAGTPFYPYFGVILTLYLSLLALMICNSNQTILTKCIVVFFLCYISQFADWPIYGVLFALAFGLNRFNFKKQMSIYLLISVAFSLSIILPTIADNRFVIFNNLYLLGFLLPIILLSFYNGERGGERFPRINKWSFYIFYPVHLLILYFIKTYLL